MHTSLYKKALLTTDYLPIPNNSIDISALTITDKEKLLIKIEHFIKVEWYRYTMLLRSEQGKEMNVLSLHSIVLAKQFDEQQNGYVLDGYIAKNHPLMRVIKEQEL